MKRKKGKLLSDFEIEEERLFQIELTRLLNELVEKEERNHKK